MKVPFFDTFISYSHKDINYAKRISKSLSDEGFDVFFDKVSIKYGERIPSRIEEALDNCIFIVPLISNEALQSKWVSVEWNFKWIEINVEDLQRCIPIIIKKCELPTSIKQRRYFDFTIGSYAKNIEKLIKALKEVSDFELGQIQLSQNLEKNEIYINSVIQKLSFYFQYSEPKLHAIKLVFNELVKNAFQHSGSPEVFLKIDCFPDYVQLNVRDKGKGFNIEKTLSENQTYQQRYLSSYGKRGLQLIYHFSDLLENSVDENFHEVRARVYARSAYSRSDKDNFVTEKISRGLMELEVKTNESKKTVIIKIVGIDLDLYHGAEVMHALQPVVRNVTLTKYIIDLSEVGYVDSAGIGLLQNILEILSRRGASLVLICRYVIKDVFMFSRLDKVFNLADTLDEAFEKLSN